MTKYQEILKLAQQKEWNKWHHYDLFSDGIFEKDERDLIGEYLTMFLIQKWLRDVHKKDVSIIPEYYKDGINWNWQVLWSDPLNDYDYKGGTGMYGDNGEYSTYEEALETGLQYTLKNLI